MRPTITDLPSRALLMFLCAIAVSNGAHAQIRINEYVAANATGITDEDGNREDWIELYHDGPSSIDLTGFGISDRIDGPVTPGHYRVAWDGRNDRGQAVVSAVYFYRLVSGNEVRCRKVTLLR